VDSVPKPDTVLTQTHWEQVGSTLHPIGHVRRRNPLSCKAFRAVLVGVYSSNTPELSDLSVMFGECLPEAYLGESSSLVVRNGRLVAV
jgi:hypothetical protein